MLAFVETRQFGARDARKHAVERFQKHDFLTCLAQHRRRLEPDIAAADHDDLPRGFGRGLHRIGIGAGAHPLHPRQSPAGDRQHARGSAGRPDELAISDRLTAIGGHAVSRRIDRENARAEQHRHFALVPIFGGTQLDAFEFFFARKIFLRQWRALIGKLRLVADDRDAARKLLRAQHDCNLRPAMTGTHNHHVKSHRFALPISAWRPLHAVLGEASRAHHLTHWLLGQFPANEIEHL